MRNKIYSRFVILCLSTLTFASCNKALDQKPLNALTADDQYKDLNGYKQVLAKVYGSYSLVSSTGTGGYDVNVAGITDPGTTDFVRAYWNMQELTTDEAICAWNDQYLQQFHNFTWNATNTYLGALYARSLFQITVCNEFLRQSTDALLSSRGITGADLIEIKHFRAETRFLRAFQYWVLMDLFGNPPMVTEADPIGTYIPKQILRKDLFAFIESELKAIDGDLVAPHTNEYARADQGAAWALLARMYLNAEVYTGTAHYTDAVTYAQKVIDAGYTLMPSYQSLFLADNDVANTETILPIAYDAVNSQNYGGTTFLICSAHGTNTADDAAAGIPGGGWLGNRATKNLPQVFNDTSDKRAIFGLGTLEITSVLDFNTGMGVSKFKNVNQDGTTPYSPNGVLTSTDFPLFRLAEMYLVYAEASKRGGGGSDGTALQYYNALRHRAGVTSPDVTSISLDDILNERQRELYWEGFRRTDLIRYGYFTSGAYLWPWKGGQAAGTGADKHYNLYPIPSTDILTNTNLVQNAGY